MTFGERLKKLRLEKGITQEKLGNIIGVSDRVIGYYEADNRFPKDDTLLNKIADYFDVSLDYLLGRTDKSSLNNVEKRLKDNNIKAIAFSDISLDKYAELDENKRKFIEKQMNAMIDILLAEDEENDK